MGEEVISGHRAALAGGTVRIDGTFDTDAVLPGEILFPGYQKFGIVAEIGIPFHRCISVPLMPQRRSVAIPDETVCVGEVATQVQPHFDIFAEVGREENGAGKALAQRLVVVIRLPARNRLVGEEFGLTLEQRKTAAAERLGAGHTVGPVHHEGAVHPEGKDLSGSHLKPGPETSGKGVVAGLRTVRLAEPSGYAVLGTDGLARQGHIVIVVEAWGPFR